MQMFVCSVNRLAQSSDPPSVTRRQGTEGQRDKDWFTVHSGEIHITQAPTWDLRVQCTVYLSTKLGQTVNYQLVFIKETKGYVCDETRQSIDGTPEVFRVVDQQRYEKAS